MVRCLSRRVFARFLFTYDRRRDVNEGTDLGGHGGCHLSRQFNQITAPDPSGKRVFAGSADYDLMRRQSMAEVNAAVEGSLAAGATEVVVTAAHGHSGRAILPRDLHPAASLISGVKPLLMVQGIDSTFAAAIFTGYHAAANTPGAVLGHTYSLSVVEARLNGQIVGEGGFNAAVVGHFGVPVAMVTGDDKVYAELKALLGPQLVGVVVKEGIGVLAAKHIHPDRAVSAIREAAERAIRGAGAMKPLRVQTPVRLEVDLQTCAHADVCEFIPGIDRAGRRTVAYTGKDMLDVMRAFNAIKLLQDPFLMP